MRSLVPLIATLLPVAYALAVAAYARAYAREGGVSDHLGPVALRVAVLLHVFYLSVRGVLEGHLPLASVYDFLSATGLSMAVVYLYIEAREGIRTTGAFVLPFVFAYGQARELDFRRLGYGGLVESGAGRRFPPYR